MQQPAWPRSTVLLLRHRWRAAVPWELRPSLAGSLLRVVGHHPLRPQCRFRHRHAREDVAAGAAHGATGPPRSWRRTPLGLHPTRSSSLAGGSRPFALPLSPFVMRIRLGGITRCTRDCTREPLVAAIFLFPDQRSGCVALLYVVASSWTLLRTRLSLHALKGCSIDARDQAITGVVAFTGGGATHAADRRHVGLRSDFTPTAVFARTPPPMLLKEDARALFSCLVYHHHPPFTVLQLFSARSC
jgi:hypothetical protein